MKPWMNNTDIQKISDLITQRFANKQIEVLEWGAGGSTSYFSKHMLKHNIKYNWTSIEYNKKWCEKVENLKLPNVHIELFDVGNDNLKQRDTNMDEYVDYPKSLNKKFDMILVDGRKRRRCLLLAATLVKPDGLVLLHDAERQYYHCAFTAYKTHKFLTKSLWVGEMQ